MSASDPVGNKSITKFDAIVIGSGAGGSSAAHVLTKNGKKVLILESGSNWFEGLDDPGRAPKSLYSNDELKLLVRRFIVPDPTIEPRSWRNRETDGVRTFVGEVNPLPRTVGGGATHADLKMPRFMPQDFHLGTDLGDIPGADFADWPVDYDMLEPFYTYGEKILGVQGKDGADPLVGPRSAPYPMGPGNPMYLAQKAMAGLPKIGLNPHPFPCAINSRPYDGRPACVECGFCSGYGCPNNAKGSPPVTTLRKAFLTGNALLLPQTRAVKLLTNGAKNAITGVECIGPDGARVTYSADQYVLAASPIEDVRLLWMSDPGGMGLGNSSGHMGRHLTFHFHTVAIGVFEERLHGHRGRTVSHCFTDFRGKPNDPDHPLGGLVEISGSEGPIQEGQYLSYLMGLFGGFNGTKFKRMMRQSLVRDHVMVFAMVGEDAPQATNRVDLDPELKDLDGLPIPRVTYERHEFELSAGRFYGPKLVDALGACGAKWAVTLPADEIPTSNHIMGTLRMGTDPTQSVCDPTGRFHDIGNLWNADGALFPTSSGFNPTMTLMALAMRVGACMVNAQSPESAIT